MAGRFWPGEEKRAGIASPSPMTKHLNIPSDLFLTKGREIERIKRHGQRVQTPLFNLVFFEGEHPRDQGGGHRLGVDLERPLSGTEPSEFFGNLSALLKKN